MDLNTPIRCKEDMISIIRTIGMIPFTKCTVPGWSIQEMTGHEFWFMSSDELGPWDWRIDAIHDGLICGKFLSQKTAFATEEMYRHLMNWRRSHPKYQVANGAKSKASTIDEKLHAYLAPTLLCAIREHESLESSELRLILEERIPLEIREKIGGYVGRQLIPKVKKQAVDFVMSYLDMGTWTVIGDITRVYRGPNCEYKGWQRNTITTPEALLAAVDSISENTGGDNPFWAKFIDEGPETEITIDCSPEESRNHIIQTVRKFFPDAQKALEKLI